MDISKREAELKRAEEELRLLQRVSLAISESEDFQSALKVAISNMCEATGWNFAEAWVPGADGKNLELNFAWHCKKIEAERFVEKSREFKFLPGIGLPGRVWLSGKPEWIKDVSISKNIFLRHEEAREVGFRAALGVPVLAGDRVLAVLIFFMPEARDEDRRLIDLVTAVSAQLGGVLLRKRAENERLDMQRRYDNLLLHSQKMEAICQLAGGIAHDFNNTFTAIIGFGNLLEMKMADEPVLKGYVDQILAASEKASDLVQDLLTFGRIHEANLWPVDLNYLVKNICEQLSRLIGDEIEINTILTDGQLMVNADQMQMERVLINLATNAKDAMPEGGAINLKLGTVELDDAFVAAHGYGTSGKHALLSFEDTGTGMDEATKQRIFEPFFTTKETGKGVGLGLSMAYSIIKQHNGFIGVDSTPGLGTVINIYLPLAGTDAVNKEQ